jgi:hypothetical protein
MKQQLLFYLYYLQRLQFVHRMLWVGFWRQAGAGGD